MKRIAAVYYNGTLAGTLTSSSTNYQFTYDEAYLLDRKNRAVSLTLPLQAAPYESNILFPFFINMLSEGANKKMQCRLLKIDEEDYFGLLLATGHDSIGPITIKPIT